MGVPETMHPSYFCRHSEDPYQICIHPEWGACSGCDIYEAQLSPCGIVPEDEALETFWDLVVGDYLAVAVQGTTAVTARKFIAGLLLTAKRAGIDPHQYDVDGILGSEVVDDEGDTDG